MSPDIVLWSRKGKAVELCELTCPWEENAEWAHERKLTKYEGLKNEIASNGWLVKVFVKDSLASSKSLRSFLTAIIGGSNMKIKSAVKECCEVAEISFGGYLIIKERRVEVRNEMFEIAAL